MTLIKTQDSSSIIEDLFEETYALYDVMNKPYKLTMKYKPIVGNAGNKTFGTAVEKFSYNMIVMEATTEVVHGDDITFNIVMVSSWNEVS
jgi:hypothetical protein